MQEIAKSMEISHLIHATLQAACVMATLPNILLTGTPGTGKTTTSAQAAERIGFKHINVSDVVKQHGCHEGEDSVFDTLILDEDKLLDVLEPILSEGGCIVDFHTADLFPERWFELVLVLRSQTDVLYDRLTQRGYSDKKRNENMECEIMEVVLEEARESYDAEIVHELSSNNVEELESNVARIEAWFQQWKENNQQP